jgi:hypothetical protein
MVQNLSPLTQKKVLPAVADVLGFQYPQVGVRIRVRKDNLTTHSI